MNLNQTYPGMNGPAQVQQVTVQPFQGQQVMFEQVPGRQLMVQPGQGQPATTVEEVKLS